MSETKTPRQRLWPMLLIAMLAAVLSLAVAACSDDDEDEGETTAAAATTTTDDDAADDDATDDSAANEDAAARTVEVTASDFKFDPAEITAKVGETVTLAFMNKGTTLHDFTSADFMGTVTAAGEAAAHDASADAPLHVAAEAGATAEITFEATEAGEYAFKCSVPGHEQLGMTGTIIVTAS